MSTHYNQLDVQKGAKLWISNYTITWVYLFSLRSLGIGDISRISLSCLYPFVFLLTRTFKLFGFQILWFWAYLVMFMPEARRVHYIWIWHIRFYYNQSEIEMVQTSTVRVTSGQLNRCSVGGILRAYWCLTCHDV
jgi:hypothetical protein